MTFCANLGTCMSHSWINQNSVLPRIFCFIAVCLSLPRPTNGMISYSDPTLGVGKPFQTAKYISPESHHRWLHLLKGLYSVPVNNDWYLVKHLRMSQNQQKIWPFAIELLHSGKDVMLWLFATNLRANVHCQQFWSFCRKAISIYPPTVLIAYSTDRLQPLDVRSAKVFMRQIKAANGLHLVVWSLINNYPLFPELLPPFAPILVIVPITFLSCSLLSTFVAVR